MAHISTIKTIAILGHSHSGKTTLTESLLHLTKQTQRKGAVEEGNTVSDWQKDEQERMISINTGFCNIRQDDRLLIILDVPGYMDFVAEAITALRAVENAVLLVDAVDGVQVGTERIFKYVEQEGVPCSFFINKIDKGGFDYSQLIEHMKSLFGNKVAPLFAPSPDNKGVINLLTSPQDGLSDELALLKQQLIDSIAETDDELLEKYLGGEISLEEEKAALLKAIAERKIYPVFCGSSLTDVGILDFYEAVMELMPSAMDLKRFEGVDPASDGAMIGQVVKTVVDPYVGQMNIVKVFSGTLNANSAINNITRGAKEKVGYIYLMQGKEQSPVEMATTGFIVAIPKLKDVHTNDIISSNGEGEAKIPPMVFPDPVISFSVKPKTRDQEDKLASALHRFANEDPTFRVQWNDQTKETLVSGMGDIHLDVVIKRMSERFGIDVEVGQPKIPYKETIKKTVKVQGKYKKQSGGRGQYGDVWIEFSPLPRGEGFVFEEKIFGGAVPKQYIPSVEKGLRNAINSGVLAGYPVVDIKAVLYDGSYHEVDSSDMAFQIAAAMAFKEGCQKASPVLLEPIMNVTVIVPDEFTGQVTGDFNSRRGRVLGMDARGKDTVIKAQVPLAEMLMYSSQLRSMTSGKGFFTMDFDHYEEVPQRIAERIISEQAEVGAKAG